jgi:serine/threonine protein kinase
MPKWYKPLELLKNNVGYDFSLDVWGYGCILAELLLSTNQYLDCKVQNV